MNEKLFMFIYIWFIFAAILGVINSVIAFVQIFTPKIFVKHLLDNECEEKMINVFCSQYVGRNGASALRFVNNQDPIIARRVVQFLWIEFSGANVCTSVIVGKKKE